MAITVNKLIKHIHGLGKGTIAPKYPHKGLCAEVFEYVDMGTTEDINKACDIHNVFVGALIDWARSKRLPTMYPIELTHEAFMANDEKWVGTAKKNPRLQMCLDIAKRMRAI